MKNINIFCFVSKSGSGKTEYLSRLFFDKRFIDKSKLKPLVYCTTRKKKIDETDGLDYHFYSDKELKEIPDEKIIECRSYYTLNDGTVYYFTKTEQMENIHNVICIASPYQYENYRNWCAKENIKGINKYNLYMIIVDTKLDIRINRIMKRAECESDIYEMCRRIIQEKSEFEDVSQRLPELIDPMMAMNVCYINNNSSAETFILKNLEKIKNFVLRNID